MAAAEEPGFNPAERRRFWPRRKRWRAVIIFFAILLGGVLLGWLTRERIATNIIEDQLEQMGLPATYELGYIGPEQQVLNNLVIGDPANPDLTIESATVHLRYRFGTPAIGRVELVRPRLFGVVRDGELSFGSLDPVIFAESDEPPGLPDLDLKLVDGRALIEGDYGPIGIKAEGEGELDDGFEGFVAATAPELSASGCSGDVATLYGRVVTGGGIARFEGPARLRSVNCTDAELSLAAADFDLEIELDPDFGGLSVDGNVASTNIASNSARVARASGEIALTWRDGQLTSKFDLNGENFESEQLVIDTLDIEGTLRGRDGFERAELDSNFLGEGLRQGNAFQLQLRDLQLASAGTLLDPLAGKLRAGLAREFSDAELRGEVSLRKTGDVISGVIPSANLRGSSGASILSLSQVQFSSAGEGGPMLAGNFSTGGREMPRIQGRMERANDRNPGLRLRMEPYAAENSSVAIPELAIAQADDGSLGFSGELLASGDIPGGNVVALRLPLNGRYNARSGLAMWRRCTEIAFDRLVLSELDLDARSLTLCPGRSAPILRADNNGLRLAAGIPSLEFSGRLADTPITMRTGAVGLAWPGVTTASDIDVVLGPEGTASRFTLASLDANFAEEIGGTFDEANVYLDAVPLDIENTKGNWSYRSDVLRLEDIVFELTDREEEDRFERLEGRGATLTLAANIIDAAAALREPMSGRHIANVNIRHDLSNSSGFANLDVPGIVFDDKFQASPPSDVCNDRVDQSQIGRNAPGLSCLTFGTVALAEGTVTGTGRIDWNETDITSSGTFGSDGLDFAAAFGPVKGASGMVEFTDLISLTTAPGQTISLAAVNPGIEVVEGEVAFALKDGQFLTVERGAWPFMGGTLTLRPVVLNMGVSEQRSYIFEINGLDAATFVTQMELGNISASGTFDGQVPIIFDVDGNGRIDAGQLVSRPPGGNLSYVGELTYEDMGAMANFAFQSLRSLDYREMKVNMHGNLAGEIITEVRFEGISQGAGTKQNFVTRQVAKLPIEFRVNIRAAFAQLLTDLRSLYDPAFVRDPRELGLLTDDGDRLRRQTTPQPPAIKPEDIIPDEPTVQTEESERMP